MFAGDKFVVFVAQTTVLRTKEAVFGTEVRSYSLELRDLVFKNQYLIFYSPDFDQNLMVHLWNHV